MNDTHETTDPKNEGGAKGLCGCYSVGFIAFAIIFSAIIFSMLSNTSDYSNDSNNSDWKSRFTRLSKEIYDDIDRMEKAGYTDKQIADAAFRKLETFEKSLSTSEKREFKILMNKVLEEIKNR